MIFSFGNNITGVPCSIFMLASETAKTIFSEVNCSIVCNMQDKVDFLLLCSFISLFLLNSLEKQKQRHLPFSLSIKICSTVEQLKISPWKFLETLNDDEWSEDSDKQTFAPENTFSWSWQVLVQPPMQVSNIAQEGWKKSWQQLYCRYLSWWNVWSIILVNKIQITYI